MCQLLLSNVQTCLWLCHHIQICCSPAGFRVRIYVLLLRVGLKKWIMGIRCFWFSTFLPPKEEEERCRLLAATFPCLSLHQQRHFFMLFSSYRAPLGWRWLILGKINLATIPGLINFQFCFGDKECTWIVGAVPAPWLWFSWDWQHCLWV